MNPEYARVLFELLVENSLRILRAGFGVNWVESAFFDIIDLLRAQPALKAHFLQRAKATLTSPDPGLLSTGMLPRELLELAAHELRWMELRELANDRIRKVFRGDTALAVSDVSHAMLEAFRPDWPDREFYRRYS